MKLSAWHKKQKNSVDLIKGIPTTAPLEEYERVMISVIYPQNRDRVLDYAAQFDSVQIGGSGYDYNIQLDDDIEHIMPDYSLYDLDYSLGFTSRGCIRNCGFCEVPEKEGMIRDNASVWEFLHPEHKKVILLDNNFQASPNWKYNLNYIIEHDLKVNINQGLDIRIMTDEFAEVLSQTKYYTWTFKRRGLHIALDDSRYKAEFLKGVDILLSKDIKPRNIMVYVLVGYNSTLKDNLERIELVKDMGLIPYIQLYNNSHDLIIRRLARWVNRKYYQFIEWEEFD